MFKSKSALQPLSQLPRKNTESVKKMDEGCPSPMMLLGRREGVKYIKFKQKNGLLNYKKVHLSPATYHLWERGEEEDEGK